MTTRIIAKPFIYGATVTALASCLAGYVWFEQSRPPILEVYVFSLKSGRSMFIRTPDDRRILIDGGSNAEIIRNITGILPFYSHHIDVIVATNTDGKNISGLIDVVKRYNIGRAYIPRYTLENLGVASSTDQIYQTFMETLKDSNIHIDEVGSGDQIPLSGSENGEIGHRVAMNILFPVTPDKFDYSKASAPEILFNILHGDTLVLSMGDASKKVQKFVASSSALVNHSIIADADVLIVSHSAVSANMSLEFMNLVRPESLVYEKAVTKKSSVAKTSTKKTSSNKKSPKKVVTDPLAAILDDNRFNLKEIGTIKIVSDGKEVTINGSN